MTQTSLCFAPRDVFEKILAYAVIPTFDLIVWCEGKGVILLRRKIAPYKGVWALPGLRMMKPESIEDTLCRIAQKEIGVKVDLQTRQFIGQYVGRFKTEHQRQDLSTCYAVSCDAPEVIMNPEHFTRHCFIRTKEEIPAKIGAMYRYFLHLFFDNDFHHNHT
jgi:ADP-ribose pyrophosphatase YjhB (NUDIX family)